VFHIDRFRPTMFGIVKDARHVPMAMNIEIPGGTAVVGYELRAVLIHGGDSIERGHYQAVYVRRGQWILADDEQVSVLDVRAVTRFLNDGKLTEFGYKPAAYLLFYEMHMR
jgi:ubiquitin C-terminal hydrolase